MSLDSRKCPPGMNPEECELARRADDEWRQWATEEIKRQGDLLDTLKQNTEDIIEFFKAGKGFFQVVKWMGAFVRWVSYIGAAVAAAWAWTKFGGPRS